MYCTVTKIFDRLRRVMDTSVLVVDRVRDEFIAEVSWNDSNSPSGPEQATETTSFIAWELLF